MMNDCECTQYGKRLKEVSIFIRPVLRGEDTLHLMYFGEGERLEINKEYYAAFEILASFLSLGSILGTREMEFWRYCKNQLS